MPPKRQEEVTPSTPLSLSPRAHHPLPPVPIYYSEACCGGRTDLAKISPKHKHERGMDAGERVQTTGAMAGSPATQFVPDQREDMGLSAGKAPGRLGQGV